MLKAISPVIGERRRRDLLVRLVGNEQSAIASEWEIAVLYCLWKQGSIQSYRYKEGQSEPDILYKSRKSGRKVIVEVTALSDRSLDDRNPIDDFSLRLRQEFIRSGLEKLGGIHQSIGFTEDSVGPILAIPERKDFDRFFRGTNFRQFLSAIQSDPAHQHSFAFSCRGGTSRLDFVPGSRHSHSSYVSPNVIKDIEKNHLANRLKQKSKQLKSSGIRLPAVVIVCDADSHFLSSTMNGVGTVDAGKVSDFFLSGRKHIELGPWIIQKGKPQGSKRINAVQLWTLHELWNTWRRGPDARSTRVTIVPNRGETYHRLSDELSSEIAASVKYLPPILAMPVNASRIKSMPYFFGETHMVLGKSELLKVKISLLSLQRLLSGELTSDRFVTAHKELVGMIKEASSRNRMISNVSIEHQADCDDDWIEFTFGDINPNKLFQEEVKAIDRNNVLPFWRRVVLRFGSALINWAGAEKM